MLKLKKRPESDNWQIEGLCPYTGRFVRRSTKTSVRSTADDILVTYLSAAREEALHGGASGHQVFAAAVIEYVSKSNNNRFIGPMLAYFGKTALRDIKDTDISDFCRDTYPNCRASTLVRQVYGPMQAIWNQAVASQMAQPRTFSKPRVEKRNPDIPTEDDLLVVLRAMASTGHERSIFQRAAVLFMSFSGARATEVVNVLVKHHDAANGRALLADTKTGVPRWTQLPPFVNAVLAQLPHDQPDAPLFGYASRWSLNRILTRAVRRANRMLVEDGKLPLVKNYSPHKLGRHLFAKRFLEDGNSLKALMDAGGWTSVKAVAVYAHIEKKLIDNAVAGVTTMLSHAPDVLLINSGESKPNDGKRTLGIDRKTKQDDPEV